MLIPRNTIMYLKFISDNSRRRTAIFINNFEDTNNQYLALFNNAWNNSKLNINTKVQELLHKDAGYSRDIKVRNELGALEKEELDCLIIYPDQDNGHVDLKDLDNKMTRLEQFSGFYKVGVKLPKIMG